jgi:putative ABC transport system permease protein
VYIFKNAWKSITRTKGRNILIGVIVVAIAVSSCIALSIRSSATKLVDSYQDNLDISATLGMDREKLRADMTEEGTKPQDMMDKIPSLTIDEIKKYGESTYVKDYYYTYSIGMNSSNITTVSNDDNNRSFGGKVTVNIRDNGDFRLIGFSNLKSMTSFISGNYKITSGSIFDENDTANDCIITDELAEANNLSVGSTITLTNPNDETIKYDFKVVGIYTDKTTTDDSAMNFFSNAANQIITNATAVSNIVTSTASNSDTKITGQLNPTFNLKDANDIDKFTSDIKNKGLNEYYTVSTNVDEFNQSIKPITNLKSFATTFLILVLIIGGVILFILNMINIRERKYEIGVLRTIGMKKKMVLSQFVIELFVVTIISLLIGTGIGSVLSVPTASSLLKNEIDNQQSKQNEIGQNFGRPGMIFNNNGGKLMIRDNNVNYIDKINATVNGTVIIQLTLIGLVLTIFSSSVAMIFISRYTPLRILSERT